MSGLLLCQERQVGPKGEKGVFIGFKNGIKCYKIGDPKDRKFILSRDATFDEASIVKPIDSQQVESQTNERILQQVESDATSPSLDRPVSFTLSDRVVSR